MVGRVRGPSEIRVCDRDGRSYLGAVVVVVGRVRGPSETGVCDRDVRSYLGAESIPDILRAG